MEEIIKRYVEELEHNRINEVPEKDAKINDYHTLKNFTEEILSYSEKKEILKKMIEIEDNLLCGDIWLTVETPKYKNGLFTQVEFKELDNGEFSESIFSVFCYENKINKDNKIETDFTSTVINFDFCLIPEEKIF